VKYDEKQLTGVGWGNLSCSFYLYRFRKNVSYGFPIINFFNPGVYYETPCIMKRPVLWNALYYETPCMWNALYMKRPVLWKALYYETPCSMKSPVYETPCIMKRPVYETSCIWNVLYMKRPVLWVCLYSCLSHSARSF
jgi:hypothetical protein